MDAFFHFITSNQVSVLAVLVPILSFLSALLVSERLKISLKKENDLFLDKLKWDFKVRESAEKIAEYLAVVYTLEKSESKEIYRLANKLSWELAIWLPDEIYKKAMRSILNDSETDNILTTVIEVRRYLLGDKAGNLTSEDVGHHAPGIGEGRS